MIDGNLHELSAQLANMTPQQRQQYAAMHKSDPNAAFIISLAKFITDTENTMRTRMQGAQMAQGMGQPQPPVADQVIAGLAGLEPEAGAIPGGGITGESPAMPEEGYAGGGMVQHYFDGGLTGITDRAGLVAPRGLPYEAVFGGGDVSKYLDQTMTPEMRQQRLEAGRNANMFKAGHVSQGGVRPTMADDPRILGAIPEEEAAGYDPVKHAIEGGKKEPVAPSGGIAGLTKIGLMDPNAVPEVDIEGMHQRMTVGNAAKVNDLRRQVGELGDQRVAGIDSLLADTQAAHAAEGVYGQEQEKRLRTREGKLNADEGENRAMSIINAGLAMMAGESPHAMVNIGKGALVGTESYAKGKEKIERARERLEEAFTRLEDVRRSETRENRKELSAIKAKRVDAVNQRLAELLAVNEKELGWDREDQKAVFTATAKEMDDRRDAKLGIQKNNLLAQVHMRGQDVTLQAAHVKSGGKGAARIERTRNNIWNTVSKEADKAFPPWTARQRNARFEEMWQQALQRDPELAQSAGELSSPAPRPGAALKGEVAGIQLVE